LNIFEHFPNSSHCSIDTHDIYVRILLNKQYFLERVPHVNHYLKSFTFLRMRIFCLETGMKDVEGSRKLFQYKSAKYIREIFSYEGWRLQRYSNV